MADNDAERDAPTRRDYLTYSSAVVGSGILAGCASDAPTERSSTGESIDATTAPDEGRESSTTDAETTTDDGSYTVELAPAGEVEFEEVPEDVFTILSHHAGMTLAVGRSDDINAMHAPGYVQSLYDKFLHHLDGVSVDWEGIYSSWPPSKEKLYELDSDVHLADPAKVASAEGWSDDDVTEVAQSVAPWFGNTFSDAHAEPPAGWGDRYRYYDLWEIFRRVAAVFREGERYEALAEVHASMLDSIEQSLPAPEERPSAAMVLFSTQDDSVWAYRLNQRGYYAAHTRPLGATDALVDAFGDDFSSGDEIGRETLLEADPDVLLVLGPMSSYHSIADVRRSLAEDEVASEVTAVKEDRVYTQGVRRQGPVVNLFQLEMTAKQLYPERFGEWPGYSDGDPYPEVASDEQLFDRDRVADVVTGDF